MASITINPEDGAQMRAVIRNHDAWTGESGEYPATTHGHVNIGDTHIVLDVEQVEELRDALTAALAEHESQAAPAA